MVYLEIFIMGVGLSFDAMAAAISLGVCSGEKMRLSEGLEISAFFGFFQALMPLIGYALGRSMATLLKTLRPLDRPYSARLNRLQYVARRLHGSAPSGSSQLPC